MKKHIVKLNRFFLSTFLVVLFLSSQNSVHAQSLPTVTLTGIPSSNISVNQSFTTQVSISGANQVGGVDLEIAYNSSVLEVTSASINTGGFLGSTGNTVTPIVDTSTPGKVVFSAFTFGSNAGPSGSGNLGNVTFRAKSNGSSTLSFTKSEVISKANGSAVVANAVGGSVTVSTFATATPLPTSTPIPTATSVPPITTTPGIPTVTLGNIPSNNILINNSFTSGVNISGANQIGGIDLKVSYNATVLEVTGATINTNGFLGSTGNTVTPLVDFSTPGEVTLSAFTFGSNPGASGNGNIGSITFRAKANGSSPLTFTKAEVTSKATGAIVSANSNGGTVTVASGGGATNTPGAATNTPRVTSTPGAGCALGSKGDANCDGRVDLVDYGVWFVNYDTTTNEGYTKGDFNGDSRVDLLDYVVWFNNYDLSSGVTSTPRVSATPGNATATPRTTSVPSATATPRTTLVPDPTNRITGSLSPTDRVQN